jgi:hypothetical protein
MHALARGAGCFLWREVLAVIDASSERLVASRREYLVQLKNLTRFRYI